MPYDLVIIGGGVGAFLMGSNGGAESEEEHVVAPAEPETTPTPQKEVDKPAEPEKTAQTQAVQEPKKSKIKISTVPKGVEVYVDGLMVGNTPYTILKPDPKSVVDLVLRKAKYKDKKVRISSRTSETMVVTLDKKVVQVRKKPAVKKTSKSSKKPKSKTSRTIKRTRPTSEVLDPWD